MKRESIAYLIAPAAPGLILLSIAILRGGVREGVWALFLILPISYIASAVIGLPLHLLLKKLKRGKLLDYVVCGLVASFVPISFVIIFPWIASHTSQHLSSLYPLMGIMAVAGGLVAAAFWMIARPDRLSN